MEDDADCSTAVGMAAFDYILSGIFPTGAIDAKMLFQWKKAHSEINIKSIKMMGSKLFGPCVARDINDL